MRIIPIKNYLLAFLLTILTFVVVLFLANYYTESKKYSTNNRMNILYHLDEKSIENYLLENHNTIIYISNSSDDTISDYEKTLKKMIIVKEYEKNIVYLDTKKVSQDFYTTFASKYFSKNLLNNNITLSFTPNLLIVENGKVSKILYTNSQSLVASDLIRFIESNE